MEGPKIADLPQGTRVRSAEDKAGRPLTLLADLKGNSLVVRAVYRDQSRNEACLFATLEERQATIRDIGCFARGALNRGIGSALLAFAEDIFLECGVARVTGHLAPADAGHRDRQVRFYLKNGYEVLLKPDRSGDIAKSLAASPWVRNNWPAARLVYGTLTVARPAAQDPEAPEPTASRPTSGAGPSCDACGGPRPKSGEPSGDGPGP